MNLAEYFVGGVIVGIVGFIVLIASIALFGVIWSGQEEDRINRKYGGSE